MGAFIYIRSPEAGAGLQCKWRQVLRTCTSHSRRICWYLLIQSCPCSTLSTPFQPRPQIIDYFYRFSHRKIKKRKKKIRFTSLWMLIYLYGRRLCHPLNRLNQKYTLGTNGEENPLLLTAEGSAPAPTNYRMIQSGVPLVEEKKK